MQTLFHRSMTGKQAAEIFSAVRWREPGLCCPTPSA
jgi:hypothetical protein